MGASEQGIRNALDDYGKKLTAALERVGASSDVDAIRTASRVSSDECKTAFASWAGLNLDPKDPTLVPTARRNILGREAATFRMEFFVATAQRNDSNTASIIAHYWRNLPLTALARLADEGRKDVNDSLALLAKYERFPLAALPAPADKTADLTLDDILKAREALVKVRGASSGTAAAGSKLIGQGANTSNPDIDANLTVLRGTDLFKSKQDYFEKLDHFLAALPVDTKPLIATLSVNKARLAEAAGEAVSARYSYMHIAQGKKDLREASLIGNGVDTASIEYSGGELTLGFREVDGGPVLQTEAFAGPWAPLRLLKSPNTKSASRDPANLLKWNIDYTITTPDKKSYTLPLTLEFKQVVPDLKDWPIPGKP